MPCSKIQVPGSKFQVSRVPNGQEMAVGRMKGCGKEALQDLEEFCNLGVVMEAVHQIADDRNVVERTDVLTIEHSP